MKLLFSFLLFGIFVLVVTSSASAQPQVTIYKNEACGHCSMYLMNFRSFLSERGITDVEEKMLINNMEVREELTRFTRERSIPLDMQGHMVVVMGNLVLEGHVPLEMLGEFLDAHPDGNYPKVVILQDLMVSTEQLESYKMMYLGSAKEFPINVSLQQAMNDLRNEKALPEQAILPLVITTGLVDSFNPCAFGVLLFFIALLFTLQVRRTRMLKIGGVYILMIFLTYLLIGLGILQAIIISDSPHFIAQVAAVAVIALGLISIKDYFFYGRWFSLTMPGSQTGRIKAWMSRATLPSAVVLGFLVGLCEFPCSGGVYVGVLSLLSISTTFWSGLFYLIVYNIMFILPLLVIIIAASNRRVLARIDRWEKKDKKYMKLANGALMIILGAILLLTTL